MSSSDSDSDNGFTIKKNLTKSISKGLEKFKSNYIINTNNTETDSELDDSQEVIETPKVVENKVEDSVPASPKEFLDNYLPIAIRKKTRKKPIIIKKSPLPVRVVNTKIEPIETINIIENNVNLEDKLTALQAECSSFIQEMNNVKCTRSQRGRKRKAVPKNQPKIRRFLKPKIKNNSINLNDDDDDDVVVIKEDLNPIVSINLLWKSIDTKIFNVRKFDRLETIVNYFINEHKINPKLLLFTINDVEINLKTNNYASLRLDENTVIEGGILPDSYLDKDTADVSKKKEGIRFKVQYDSHRNKQFDIFLKADDKMDVAYSQVVQEIGLNIEKFKLSFDGSVIKHTDTISGLDIEDGDIIDVIV